MPQLGNQTPHSRRLGIQRKAEALRRQNKHWLPERIAAEAKRQWAAEHLHNPAKERHQ